MLKIPLIQENAHNRNYVFVFSCLEWMMRLRELKLKVEVQVFFFIDTKASCVMSVEDALK